jgi:agmatine/peptidylarginine deiminase
MAELKYLPAGIRLHAQEFIYKITNKLNDKYYISFANIADGLKAEKILKKNKFDFKSIPVPDDIFEACGVAIVSNHYENIVKVLKENSIEVEVFVYEDNIPVKIYGDLEKEGCRL